MTIEIKILFALSFLTSTILAFAIYLQNKDIREDLEKKIYKNQNDVYREIVKNDPWTEMAVPIDPELKVNGLTDSQKKDRLKYMSGDTVELFSD